MKDALGSQGALELTDRMLASEEMQRALGSIASSPELRNAIARQSAGLAEEVVAGMRDAAIRFDDRAERSARRRVRAVRSVYAGIGTRAVALAIDSAAIIGIFVSVSAVVALVASLVGGIHSHWLAGAFLGGGWVLLAGGYLVLFWSAAGQTPGMRLLRLRLHRHGGGRLSLGRAIVRAALRRELNASAVEMEGAAVIQVCNRFGVPAIVIRSILMPAVLELFGRYTWAFPSWFDRRLPRLAIEPAPQPAAALDEAA